MFFFFFFWRLDLRWRGFAEPHRVLRNYNAGMARWVLATHSLSHGRRGGRSLHPTISPAPQASWAPKREPFT